MIIEVCSRSGALKLAAAAQVSTSVISITSTEEDDLEFSGNTNIRSVLHLKFNDLTEEYDEYGMPYGRPLPKQKDFDSLRDFVTALDCDRLIVHCWEGVSRSAAVAQAIYEFRGRTDTVRAEQPGRPNPLVVALARHELVLQ